MMGKGCTGGLSSQVIDWGSGGLSSQEKTGDVEKRGLRISETEMKFGHLEYVHADKEMQAEEKYVASSH